MKEETMPTLAESLQKSMSTPVMNPSQAGASILQQQQQAGSINQAVSGKAPVAGPGPSRSTLGTQVAAAQTNQAASNQQQQADVQAALINQQAEQQQAEKQLSNEALDEQSLGMRQQMLQRQSEILNEFTQGGRQLDLTKDKSKMEQLGFNMRLSNEQYLNQLQIQGQKSRLNDATAFQEEMKRTIYSDEEELMRDDLEFRRLLSADSRDFKDLLAQLDISTALDIAKAENSAANQRAMWEGVSSVVSGGAEAYGKGMFDTKATSNVMTDSNVASTKTQSAIPDLGSV